MEECVCEESVCVCQIIPFPQSLSTPQPEFETDQRTWSNCLLLHHLLIIGDEEQVLNRREELDRDLLLQTCSFKVIPGQGRRSSSFSKWTALHLAAQFKSSATVVRALIEAGADVDALNSNLSSPLHRASLWNPAVVPILLEAGATVNVLNKWRETPLCYAVLQDHRSAIEALLAAGADPLLGESPRGRSPLRYISPQSERSQL